MRFVATTLAIAVAAARAQQPELYMTAEDEIALYGGGPTTTTVQLPAITPPKRAVDPNILTRYVKQLYIQADAIINRAIQLAGGNRNGPLVAYAPLMVPEGYEVPKDFDQLFARALYYIGRCYTNYVPLGSGGSYPMGKLGRGSDLHLNAIPRCLDKEANYAMIKFGETMGVSEFRNMMNFLEKHRNDPEALPLKTVAVPTLAHVPPGRSFTPLTYEALTAIPQAMARMWDRIYYHSRRLTMGRFGFPDFPQFDEMLQTPLALREFGFPPGFHPEGIDKIASEVLFHFIACRSGIKTRAELSEFGFRPRPADAPDDWDEDFQTWYIPPNDSEDPSIKRCIDSALLTYFKKEYRNFNVKVMDQFIDFLHEQDGENPWADYQAQPSMTFGSATTEGAPVVAVGGLPTFTSAYPSFTTGTYGSRMTYGGLIGGRYPNFGTVGR